jgi:hypothetical protein
MPVRREIWLIICSRIEGTTFLEFAAFMLEVAIHCNYDVWWKGD